MDEFVKKQSVKDAFERYGTTDDAILTPEQIKKLDEILSE